MPQRARSRQSHLKDCRKPSKPQFIRKQKLKDVADIDYGFAFNSDFFNEDGNGLPLVRIRDLKRGFTKTYTTEIFDERYLVDSGDMLIGMDGEFNLTVWQAGPALLNQRVCRIRAKKSQVREGYLRFFLPVSLKHIEDRTSCVTVKHLSAKVLNEITLPNHSLTEQQALADKFIYIEKATTLAIKNSAYLDNLVKSRFIEMFGDPCDPGSSSAKNRIDSFCELRIGPFGSALHKEDYITGGHPLVNPSHIIGGAIRPDENLTIDDGKYESLAAYHLLPGDVVLGRRGEIGRCAVVKTDGLICGTGSMIIRPGQKVRSDYLQRVVSFPSFSHALEANAVGVTTKNLNAKIVGSAEVFLPDLKDQDAFITLVSQIDK